MPEWSKGEVLSTSGASRLGSNPSGDIILLLCVRYVPNYTSPLQTPKWALYNVRPGVFRYP